MRDTIKVELVVHTGFAGCTHRAVIDIDSEFWESLTPAAQADHLDGLAVDYREELVACSARVLESTK